MKAAVIIPVYNNATTVAAVIRGALEHSPRVIVINDGSTDGTKAVLDAFADLTVVHLLENRGKGHALMRAFAEAHAMGAEVAVTIDADGQHDPQDIPRLLSVACPDSITIGVRRMDVLAGDVPRSSRFGRAFSNFWVRCETSLKLKDTQSGFRAYPLRYFSGVLLKCARYDFEIEALVRLVWAGARVKEVDIGVFYPPRAERISHFHPFWDNLRLTLLHTKLCVLRGLSLGRRLYRTSLSLRTALIGVVAPSGRLWPLPRSSSSRLVANSKTFGKNPDATPVERGGAGALGWMYRRCGLRVCYTLLPFVLMYFYLTGRASRRAMAQFYRSLGEQKPWRLFWKGFRNYHYFAVGLLDRLALASGARHWEDQVVSVSGQNTFERGTILVGAHFGDWTLSASGLAAKNGRPVHVVMNPHLTPRFAAMLKGLMGKRFAVIDATMDGFSIAMAVRDVIDQNGLVCFMADRKMDRGLGLRMTFLGAETELPYGPFALAHLLKCPVYSFYCLKSGLRPHAPYLVSSQELWDGEGAPGIAALAASFRDDLEVRVRRSPHHWFNFFEFWPKGTGKRL